jgi:pilus assembly protein CpaB
VSSRRRRGLVLLSLGLASGGLAASQVRDRERDVEARVGPLVPVLVAARDLEAGDELGEGAVRLREVPARFTPPDGVGGRALVAGARTAVPIAEGSYLTAGQLRGARPRGGTLRRGERALEIAVAGGETLLEATAGARVDVLVTSEPQSVRGRTAVALEGVELLALRQAATGFGAPDRGDGPAATAVATLRVTLRQAVYLTAAENFGREIRLLVRPPHDRARTGAGAVTAADL